MTSSRPLLLLLCALGAAHATDYFFRFIGGNAVTHGERLRLNNSYPHFSPGVTAKPHNPADHFTRIYVNDSAAAAPPPPAGSAGVVLYVVPTNPHPPPVPGYYGLSAEDNVTDAYRLVQTYRPEDFEADGSLLYTSWRLLQGVAGGKVLLRYGSDADAEGYRWIAVKETSTTGVDRWVPWWVRPGGDNYAALDGWEYDVADVELVEATGPVNSSAPGGVEE
ncbi:hypothetical protein VTK56DRAFT_3591 [Thermocarpiscus australiensis]